MNLPPIPVAKPDLTEAEVEAAAKVIRSGWLTQGPVVHEFESKLREFTGAKSVYCVTSCTTGLQLAFQALGLKAGDEVIVPSLSFIASANSVVHAGATPVFADVRLDDNNLDIESVRAAISPKTKAILLVHQSGLPADIDAFAKLAKENGLFLVEDAACAIGSTYKGAPIGSHSDLVVFSFHPRKVLTTGEGGAVAYNGDDPEIGKHIEICRRHGMSDSVMDRHKSSKVVIESYPLIGYNFRMTDIQAAIGIVQLERLPGMIQRRRERGAQYIAGLKGVKGVRLPHEPAFAKGTYQTFLLAVQDSARVSSVELMERLLEDKIATRRGIVASHLEPCYERMPQTRRVSLKNTELAVRENVVLPMYSGMTAPECDRVIEAILKYI